MRQHGNYADSGVNPMMAAQMHHMAAQKSQHNPGVNQFPGREGSLRAEDERQYIPKAEGQWQWDREASKPSNSLPSHMLDEGQGSEPSRPLYQGHRSESKLVLDKQTNKDLEIGYDDNNLPLTFDGLEQKFLQDFLKLTKEQQDAEDIENARHREVSTKSPNLDLLNLCWLNGYSWMDSPHQSSMLGMLPTWLVFAN
ncbi:hypothetical protein IHE45_08G126700 [Dioscorea alata]|nr:hypothetical protein IHE45_08G126700 [Dioscorea alata]KAH7675296.1 hypothetical protein IHE45_08G126700 [Dioscorea alata]